MRFSRLSFRVTFILVSVSFLAICASTWSKGRLPGAVLVSEGSVFAVPLEVSVVKKQAAPIPTWTAVQREDAARPETITSQKI
ncbi:MAG TPA: hypothetical protein VGP66_12045 [Candidatus Acidoferrum sp.]|jgi:hypothetical protein|nr:hypothetical protein [Candidatus Acidoferrum sp.]